MAGTALPPTITDATVTLTAAGVNTGIVAGQYYGYCTIADVKYELPNIDSYDDLTATAGSGIINMNGNSLIAQEITYGAIELLVMLDHYYVMPYAGSNAVILMTLRELNAKLTSARIIDRYFSGGEANVSPSATQRRAHVTGVVMDIEHGRIRWDAPFGDATARAMTPIYDLSKTATIMPDPATADEFGNAPRFTMGRLTFRRGTIA